MGCGGNNNQDDWARPAVRRPEWLGLVAYPPEPDQLSQLLIEAADRIRGVRRNLERRYVGVLPELWPNRPACLARVRPRGKNERGCRNVGRIEYFGYCVVHQGKCLGLLPRGNLSRYE